MRGPRVEALKGVECGEGVSPSPQGEGSGELCPLPRNFFSNVDIKWCNLVHSGGFFRLFSNIATATK